MKQMAWAGCEFETVVDDAGVGARETVNDEER